MTIDQAYRFILYVANKEQRGNIPPADFNLLAPIAQMSVLNDRLGNIKKYQPHDPTPPYGVGISQKLKEELRRIYKVDSVNMAGGSFPYPSDCIYVDSVSTQVSGISYLAKPTEYDEFTILSRSVIKPPTPIKAIYTLYQVTSGVSYFAISPNTDPLTGVIYYIRRPTNPFWNNVTPIVNNTPVYQSSGSQDFELSETTHMEICMKILAAVGINLDAFQLTQYAAMEEAKGS